MPPLGVFVTDAEIVVAVVSLLTGEDVVVPFVVALGAVTAVVDTAALAVVLVASVVDVVVSALAAVVTGPVPVDLLLPAPPHAAAAIPSTATKVGHRTARSDARIIFPPGVLDLVGHSHDPN